jgi:hypothetical protein
MTQPTNAPSAEPGEAFADAARRPRLRDRVSTVDQVMTVVAAGLLPLGLVVVFFGWYGAARTPYLFEQLPYLASGGLIGLGLIVTGGFVLFGSWIARTAREQALRDQTLIAAVHELRDELTRMRLAAPEPQAAPPAQRGRRKAPAVVQTNGAGGSLALVATARGSMLHRPHCAIVTGRDDVHDVSDPDAEGLRPCRLCDPLGAAPVRA